MFGIDDINKFVDLEKDGHISFAPNNPVNFNAHTHLCRANWKPKVSNLKNFLKQVMQYRSVVSQVEIIAGITKALNHMLANGITGYISHQNHRHIRKVIETAKKFPLQHNFARMCTDNFNQPDNLRETPDQAINETIKLTKEFPNIGILFGPTGLVDCSLEIFEAYGDAILASRYLGLQTHVAEEYYVVEKVKKKYGQSEVELLNKTGCLNENTFLVHCTHISDKDIELIIESNSKVVVCPRSSFNTKTFSKLIENNIPVLLGTDAFCLYRENMREEWEHLKTHRV